VDVNLISGPFRKLLNRWKFIPEGEGTRVEFEIDFQFKSRILEGLLTSNFHHAVDRLMTCFEDRARALHGG
jgi:coenzyme Q-binding protein COQ10